MQGEKMTDDNPKSKAETPKTAQTVSKAPNGYISLNSAMEKYDLSYDQVYWMIRKNYIGNVQVKKSSTRPVWFVCEEDVCNRVDCKNVTAEDYERLRAEKLAVEIRLKKLKEQEYIEEIKAQEEAKFQRIMRWVFGDMKSWPDIFEFSDEQRALWNENLDRVSERIEEVS